MIKYDGKENLVLNDKIKFDSKGGAILGVLEGPVADFIHPTRNGRTYNEELWEKVLHNDIVKEQFANGGILGELDHPKDRDDICTEKVAVIMPEPPVKKNGEYWGKFNILDTPCGRIVYTLAKAGFKLGVSSRGNGDYDEYTGEVDPDTYDFTCFDVVVLPAVKDARMNLVTEGLNNKDKTFRTLITEQLNRSSDTDKKIMNETLKHLKENLDNPTEQAQFKKDHPEFSKNFDFGRFGKFFDKDGKLIDEKGYLDACSKMGEAGTKIREAYSKHKCVICGKSFEGYGNNAEPIQAGICCDECNAKQVIPARMKEMGAHLKESLSPWQSYSRAQLDEVNEEAGIERGEDEHLDSYYYLYLPSSKGKVEFGVMRSTYDGKAYDDLSICLGGLYEHIVDTKKVIDAFGLNVPSLSGDYADEADKQITKAIDDLDQKEVDQLLVDLGFKPEDLTESKEKKEIPDISVKDDTLTVDIDETPEVEKPEGEEEPCEECEEFDTKLKDFLDAFLKTQDLETEGEEEKDLFVKLFHETFPELDCHCDEHDDKEVGDDETIPLAAEDDGAEDEDVALLEQLQRTLKENKVLKDQVRELQTQKAVGNSKVSKLQEEVERFKTVAAQAGKKALTLEHFESDNRKLGDTIKTLNENLSKANDTINKGKAETGRIQEGYDKLTKENQNLKSELLRTKDSSSKLEEKYQRSQKLVERYKNLAYDIANRYIDSKALALGVSSNEIKNRLNESYTLDDVDKVCDQLQKQVVNISKLPFQLDKPGSMRARLRENRNSDPLKDMDSEYDDTVDDYLLDLAGLNK